MSKHLPLAVNGNHWRQQASLDKYINNSTMWTSLASDNLFFSALSEIIKYALN